jgi:hypothetical protein
VAEGHTVSAAREKRKTLEAALADTDQNEVCGSTPFLSVEIDPAPRLRTAPSEIQVASACEGAALPPSPPPSSSLPAPFKGEVQSADEALVVIEAATELPVAVLLAPELEKVPS